MADTKTMGTSEVRGSTASHRHGSHTAAYLLWAFLVLALLTGGGSRPDVMSHVILRPVAVVLGVYAVWTLDRESFLQVRAVAVGLIALAGIMLIQLIPLPPLLWTSLPGRELAEAGAQILGIEQPWRPISLSPARTWNSFVSLLPPMCALLLFARSSNLRRPGVLIVLLVCIGASAVLGIAQRAGAEDGPLYLYRITNAGSAVGFFANRNHQAAMLAVMVPMLAAFVSLGAGRNEHGHNRKWIAFGVGLALVPLLLATGSRAGLVLFVIAIAASVLLLWSTGHGERARRRISLRMVLLLALAGVGLAVVTYMFAQAEALSRLSAHSVTDDLRVRLLPTYLTMVRDSFPVGFGFGSFDAVFRAYEPVAGMGAAYLNHAHNDIVEVIIDGGLPAAILLLVFAIWFLARSVAVWRQRNGDPAQIVFGRLGSVVIALLVLASLTDYPLRVPFVMIVFVLAAAWLEGASRTGRQAQARFTAWPFSRSGPGQSLLDP
jgi:O-antigen ligase